MITKDAKWPSTQRRRDAKRNKQIAQSIAVASGLNLSFYCLATLAPYGLWLALGGLMAGCIVTTSIIKDIINDK